VVTEIWRGLRETSAALVDRLRTVPDRFAASLRAGEITRHPAVEGPDATLVCLRCRIPYPCPELVELVDEEHAP
jgi:hypothetical protein